MQTSDQPTPDNLEPTEKIKDPAAVALGRRGGLKGGKARFANLSPAERSAVASHAAKARWAAKRAEKEAQLEQRVMDKDFNRQLEYVRLRASGRSEEEMAAHFKVSLVELAEMRGRLITFLESMEG